jgi:hypothetical protein
VVKFVMGVLQNSVETPGSEALPYRIRVDKHLVLIGTGHSEFEHSKSLFPCRYGGVPFRVFMPVVLL